MCQEDKSSDKRIAANMRRTSEEWTEVRGPRVEAGSRLKVTQIVYYTALTVVLVGTHCNSKMNITIVSNTFTLIDIDSAEVSLLIS